MTRLPMLSLVVCLGCNAADALAPAGATRVELGPRFAAAWRAVEGCSGLAGNPHGVAVFSVQEESIRRDGRAVVAYWSPATNSIYVASFYLTSDPVLRHAVRLTCGGRLNVGGEAGWPAIADADAPKTSSAIPFANLHGFF